MRMTGNRGVDTAIEAAGLPAAFEMCQAMIAPGGTIANICVHGNKVDIQLELLWDRAVFAPQAVQHNPDLLFSRILFAGRPTDVFHNPLGRCHWCLGFLSCLMNCSAPMRNGSHCPVPQYTGRWRGTDRFCLGRRGSQMSVIAPVFSFGLNGYKGLRPA